MRLEIKIKGAPCPVYVPLDKHCLEIRMDKITYRGQGTPTSTIDTKQVESISIIMERHDSPDFSIESIEIRKHLEE